MYFPKVKKGETMALRQPDDVDGFYETVWDIVRQVSHGRVTTFGQIASMIPPDDTFTSDADLTDWAKLAPRWVGDAMNKVSFIDDPTIPWHRVINAKGGISLPEGSRTAALQHTRLEGEGIVFNAKDLVDLDVYGWDGPDADWLAARGLNTPRPIRQPRPDTDGPKGGETGGQMSLFQSLLFLLTLPFP